MNCLANPYTYTGRRLDPETGLYYYRNRYYHAQLGRFVSRDPIGYEGGWNLYRAYFGLNGTDPFGLAPRETGATRLQWHHLLDQHNRKKFEAADIDIDKAEWGWIIDDVYHGGYRNTKGGVKLPGFTYMWTQEWNRFFASDAYDPKTFNEDVAREFVFGKQETVNGRTFNRGGIFNKYRRWLKNGEQAMVSHKEWGVYTAAIRGSLHKAEKYGGIVKLKLDDSWKRWFGRGTKAPIIMTFAYDYFTGDVVVALENAAEDAGWPWIQIAKEAGEVGGFVVREAERTGDLEKGRLIWFEEALARDPNSLNVDLPRRDPFPWSTDP